LRRSPAQAERCCHHAVCVARIRACQLTECPSIVRWRAQRDALAENTCVTPDDDRCGFDAASASAVFALCLPATPQPSGRRAVPPRVGCARPSTPSCAHRTLPAHPRNTRGSLRHSIPAMLCSGEREKRPPATHHIGAPHIAPEIQTGFTAVRLPSTSYFSISRPAAVASLGKPRKRDAATTIIEHCCPGGSRTEAERAAYANSIIRSQYSEPSRHHNPVNSRVRVTRNI
jgi:hypothetical protein